MGKYTTLEKEFYSENPSPSGTEKRKHRIISLDKTRIIIDTEIEEMGMELFNYLEGETSGSDSNADYCIDFKKVDFMCAPFLGKLITFDKKHQAFREKRHTALVNIRKEIYEIFEITKLNKFFDIYRDVEEYKSRYKIVS